MTIYIEYDAVRFVDWNKWRSRKQFIVKKKKDSIQNSNSHSLNDSSKHLMFNKSDFVFYFDLSFCFTVFLQQTCLVKIKPLMIMVPFEAPSIYFLWQESGFLKTRIEEAKTWKFQLYKSFREGVQFANLHCWIEYFDG